MNRRDVFKALFGTAVAVAVGPAFVWREWTLSEIIAETLRKNQQHLLRI